MLYIPGREESFELFKIIYSVLYIKSLLTQLNNFVFFFFNINYRMWQDDTVELPVWQGEPGQR